MITRPLIETSKSLLTNFFMTLGVVIIITIFGWGLIEVVNIQKIIVTKADAQIIVSSFNEEIDDVHVKIEKVNDKMYSLDKYLEKRLDDISSKLDKLIVNQKYLNNYLNMKFERGSDDKSK